MAVSEGKPSIDPVQVLLERGVRSPVDKSVAASVVGLVYLAKQNLEEGRRRQCLEAADAILKIDPDHAEARDIRTSVRAELDRDFRNAQALAINARLRNDRMLYGQAEAALRRVVEADPENLEAKTLLLETVSAGHFLSGSDTVTETPTDDAPSGSRVKRRSILVASVAVGLLVAALALSKGIGSQIAAQPPAGARTAKPLVSPPVEPTEASLTAYRAPDVPVMLALSANGSRGETSSALRLENADPLLRAVSPPAPRPAAPSTPNAVPTAMGALAVSAAVPVEIYRGEELLGSTPATLQLPAGIQTLEYRYQGLRQTLSHLIKARETTTATVSFVTKVQINARPWAQVSVDGVELRPIGQTPLGDVSLPIGSVLVFQNPGFPDKRYRVTAKDASIQVTFP